MCQMCILIEGIVLIFLPCTCRVIRVWVVGGLTVAVDHRHQAHAHLKRNKRPFVERQTSLNRMEEDAVVVVVLVVIGV